MSEERKGFMIGALPWWQALIAVALCAIPMYMGLQSKSMSGTLCSIFLSSYVIFIFTSLLDTPFVYLARRISERRKAQAA